MQRYSIYVQPGHVEKTDDLAKAENIALHYAGEVFDNEINEVVFSCQGLNNGGDNDK